MTVWLASMWGLNHPIPEAKSSTILTIAVSRPGRGRIKHPESCPQCLEEAGEWLINSILLEHAVLLQSDLLD